MSPSDLHNAYSVYDSSRLLASESPDSHDSHTSNHTNSTTHDDHHGHHEHHHFEDHLLMPFILLLLGAGLRHGTKGLPVPYTMQLLLLGLILGMGAKQETMWFGDEGGKFYESVYVLAKLDPHLLLHIFLPPLVFESAASLEWHLFDKAKTYIFVLACPGILVATAMTGQVINTLHKGLEMTAVEPYCNDMGFAEWPGEAGLLIGVILR